MGDTNMSKDTATPGPFRAEGASIKAVSHGKWFTVARFDGTGHTKEANEQNCAAFASAVNHHADLVPLLEHLVTKGSGPLLMENARALLERING